MTAGKKYTSKKVEYPKSVGNPMDVVRDPFKNSRQVADIVSAVNKHLPTVVAIRDESLKKD